MVEWPILGSAHLNPKSSWAISRLLVNSLQVNFGGGSCCCCCCSCDRGKTKSTPKSSDLSWEFDNKKFQSPLPSLAKTDQ